MASALLQAGFATGTSDGQVDGSNGAEAQPAQLCGIEAPSHQATKERSNDGAKGSESKAPHPEAPNTRPDGLGSESRGNADAPCHEGSTQGD